MKEGGRKSSKGKCGGLIGRIMVFDKSRLDRQGNMQEKTKHADKLHDIHSKIIKENAT